jgi:hypothetical protein
MPIFEDLQVGSYYLIREKPGEQINLVSVLMSTETAILIRIYFSEAGDSFRIKSDPLNEVVEELDGEAIAAFEGIYEDGGATEER